MYLTPPPLQTIGPPLFFREPRDIGPLPFKNHGHAAALGIMIRIYMPQWRSIIRRTLSPVKNGSTKSLNHLFIANKSKLIPHVSKRTPIFLETSNKTSCECCCECDD